ncbi:aminoglycoside phosphotransferase family protein [Aspergillus ibericus CBS 121593]|uniref:Kinase-like protein n=1 Tax=Aspergillus ibericus CBS 121593 TaxID=1448316 RepID=A0A395HAP5_9EURO|nr:kinase-like protein [Aspergillus ibericus CBS 121593]RAL04726.1 kinase-like protein [Aspergillus ibericus CBS 121593]
MTTNPCAACSWTPERQRRSFYESQVKLISTKGNRGIWSIGNGLILKDRGPGLRSFETFNANFVREKTIIPVPTIIGSWQDGDRVVILMKRIPGEPLSKLWPKLKPKERESIAKQTAGYLSQLRRLTSDKIQGVGNRPIYSNLLFPYKRGGDSFPPHGPFSSDDALWADMGIGIKKTFPASMYDDLRRVMPPAKPYTFTHCDLASDNIMVQDGKVKGILDWEYSGYFPVWWEYVCTSAAFNQEDQEWKTLLRKHLRDFTRARDWWSTYCVVCNDVEEDDESGSNTLADSVGDGEGQGKKTHLERDIRSDGDYSDDEPYRSESEKSIEAKRRNSM